jgi:Tfp pilus assembly protein PilV
MNRSAPPARGFTIIEVLAAFLLIAIVLPAIAKGISVCARAATTARVGYEAAALADAKLGELMVVTGWEGQTLSGDFSPIHPEYRWAAASIAVDDSTQEVTVIVSWTDVTGERSWSLSNLVYRETTTATDGSTGGTTQ